MTNPLRRQPATSPSYGHPIIVNGHTVPTEIHEYAAWLNSRDKRDGTWRVLEKDGERRVEFMTEKGSTDWLREKGFAPKIGKRA